MALEMQNSADSKPFFKKLGSKETNNGYGGSGDRSASSSNSQNGRHCHSALGTRQTEIDKRARKKLIIASILCLLFTIGEAVGGILAGSLAIATDSAHMLTDFASFMISLLAIYLASRPPTKNLSFGWHRAEIIGALVSVQLIWIVTGVLVYMAIQRVQDQTYTIEADVMLITAGCAVGVNILLGVTLHGVGGHGHSHGGHGHSHQAADTDTKPILNDVEANANSYGAIEGASLPQQHQDPKPHKENINVRAALIHVIGDFIQSIGVLIAAIIIKFKPEYKLADPICTFIFSLLVLFSTFNILKDAVRVLMEATPQHIDFGEMREILLDIDGVKDVHNLRIWSLTTTKFTMSVHLTIDSSANSQNVLHEASNLVCKRYDIQDPTIQIELYTVELEDCDHCKDAP